MFEPGDYVRHSEANIGTGQVIAISAHRVLGKDNKIRAYISYSVRWLDQDGRVSDHSPEQLAPSVRSVPKFTSVEEADAWMEAQRSGGAWMSAVEDTNATVATILDRTAAEIAADAEAMSQRRCGGQLCGCQDCTKVAGDDPRELMHVGSCQCEARGCPCSQ